MNVKVKLMPSGVDRMLERFESIWSGAKPLSDVLVEEASLPPRIGGPRDPP